MEQWEMHLVLGNAGATSGWSLEASGLPGDQLIASHRLRIANPTTMMAGQGLVRALVVNRRECGRWIWS